MAFDPLAGDPLRADDWQSFVGQKNLKDRLYKHLQAAVLDGRPPGHMLLMADPGFGKTTLARVVARTVDVPFEVLTMPVNLSEIVTLLVVREFDGVLLLDELHRATDKQQEDLLTLVESNYIQYRGEKYVAGWLMIVAATTEPKKVIKTLRDRFPFIPDMDPYTRADLTEIVQRMTAKLGVVLPVSETEVLGAASGGTPRHARRFALAARDLKVINGGKVPTALEILRHLRIDERGLTVSHWRYLEALVKLGGQAGLGSLSNYLNESPAVVEELERQLVRMDLVAYEERGRRIRTEGYALLRKGLSP